MPHPLTLLRRLGVASLLSLSFAASAAAQGTLTLRLEDYATVPLSGQFVGSTDNSIYAARVNFLREEPAGGLNRFFVCDLNGKLSIVDKTTKQFTTYLDFQRNAAENAAATGLFPAFTRAQGYANGLVTFAFDPLYRDASSPHYGKFYTVHIEIDTNDGDARRLPNASAYPNFTNAAAYTNTAVNEAPGTDNTGTRHAVLIEWQDTNPLNTTFEGTARELLRIEFNGRIHPMGDLLFNPLATTAAHADWRKLYIAVGDGGAGEQNNTTLHPTPQRLDVLQGKILRISPDDPDGSGPLRYGLPADNPFGASTSGNTRGEIWAYGFRNPHRISWDPVANVLIASDIGFHTWEEVNIVKRGANYGWGEREGTFVFDLRAGTSNGTLPVNDASNNYTYPVIQYPHSPALGFGDAVAGGFVYRGTRIPALQGKFIFGDITTGQVFYADLAALQAADDGNPATLAAFSPIELLWDNPRDAAPAQRYDRMYEIVVAEYRARGGTDENLPGAATVSDLTGGGRADIRFAVDAAGELYILSKSDGMIRALTGVVTPTTAPTIVRQPTAQTIAVGGSVAFSVQANEATAYQWKRNGIAIVGATGATFTLRNTAAADAGNYTVDAINTAGTVTSAAAALAVEPAANASRLTNLSIRSTAGTGAQTLIVGFVLDGPAGASFNRELLARGIGPSLAQFGVAGFLPDPKITLIGNNRRLEADNWWEPNPNFLDGVSSRFGAFTLAPGTRDAMLAPSDLTRGAYSFQITSAAAGQSGIALAELFDTPGITSNTREFVNVSARTQVTAGEGTLIAGFSISGGTTARTVVIRAAGPALTAFNVPGVLSDPRLTLFREKETTPIASNDNWQTSSELVDIFASLGAFPFTARARDAVLYLTLPPGTYSAHVNGVSSPNGVALVEVYVLP